MDLSHHLKKFVRVFNVAGDILPQDFMLMEPATLVARHMQRNTPPEMFRSIVHDQNLQFMATGTFICDFEHGEEEALVKVATTYQGAAWEVRLKNTNDLERNEFYAVFANPMDAYSFVQEAALKDLGRST